MKENFKHFKTFFAFIPVTLVMLFYGSYYYETNATIDDPDYLEAQKNPVNSDIAVTFDYHPVVPEVIQSLDTITLQANPGPANNGGSTGWALFFDLIAHSNNVAVTQMSTANTGAASVNFSVEIFTRSGTALGGPVGSGPGSSTAGWTSLGTVPAVQGSTNSGISLIFTIPTIQVNAFDTVGVAVKFTGVGPRYFGTGSPPYEFYSDANLTLKAGDGRSAPFTPTGSWFASRALTGVVRYVVSSSVPLTWSEQTSPVTTELNSVSAVNDDIAWASGAAGKVVRTLNSGAVWTNVSGDLPTTGAGYCIWAFDGNNALVTTSPTGFAYIHKTTNGGQNWVQVFSQTGGFGNGFHFINATTGFFAGDHVGTRMTIFKTTNAGSTWDSTGQLFSTTSDGWNNSMFGIGNQIWIGTNSTTIVYSSNAGVNWTAQTTSVANQYAIWFNSATVGMAGGPSTATWKTTNSGVNWAVIPDSITNNCTGLCGSGTSWWQTTFSTKVFYSPNDGASWATQYIAPAGNFRHITKARTGETLWGVRSNGGISRYGTPLTGITPITGTVPDNYNLSQNYPNPFNPVTKISFAIPKSGFVTLKVYDMLGREVVKLVNENKTAGNYLIDFDASNLSSGIYFYRIETNGFVDTKKLMLLK